MKYHVRIASNLVWTTQPQSAFSFQTQTKVSNSGSCSQLARVDIYGVPADDIVNTTADITIMGGKLFALVAATARLKKRNFQKPDKVPRNFDRREFQLDSCMEMDITFEGKTLIVRQEVARQLKCMQQDGMIQPSNSLWSSPVVIVRKKDVDTIFAWITGPLIPPPEPIPFPSPALMTYWINWEVPAISLHWTQLLGFGK